MKIGRPFEYTKKQLLDAALVVSKRDGYLLVTREQIAKEAGCSPALINKYFGTMVKLRRAIMSAAINRCDMQLIAQGLIANDSKANSIKPELKRSALERFIK